MPGVGEAEFALAWREGGVALIWSSVGMCWNCCGEVDLKILHIAAKNSSRHF